MSDFVDEVTRRYHQVRRPSDMSIDVFNRRLGSDMRLFTILSTSVDVSQRLNAIRDLTLKINSNKSILFTVDDFARLNEFVIQSLGPPERRSSPEQRRRPPQIPLPEVPVLPSSTPTATPIRTPLVLKSPPKKDEFEEDIDIQTSISTENVKLNAVETDAKGTDPKKWVENNCYESESYIFNEDFKDPDTYKHTVTIKVGKVVDKGDKDKGNKDKYVTFDKKGNCMLMSELVDTLRSCKLSFEQLESFGKDFILDASRWTRNMTEEEMERDQDRQYNEYIDKQLSLLPTHIMSIAVAEKNKKLDNVGKNTGPSGRFILRLPISSQIYVTIGSIKRVLDTPNVKTWYALPLFGGKRRRIFNVGGVYGRSLNHGQIPGFKIYKLYTKDDLEKGQSVVESDEDYPITLYAFERLQTLFGFNKARSALSLVNILVESLIGHLV